MTAGLIWANWVGGRDPDPRQGMSIAGQGTSSSAPLSCNKWTQAGLMDQDQSLRTVLGVTWRSSLLVPCRHLHNFQLSKNATARGEKHRGRKCSEKSVPKTAAGRQETGSCILSPPCLTHSPGATDIVWEPLFFPCSSSNGQSTAASRQQKPPYGHCLISLPV